MLAPGKKSYDQPRQHIKKQRHYFANKGPSNQSYGFSNSHVWMWQLNYKESWVQKNWCFWTVVLEKTLESPLDCKEIQLIYPKGNQSWIFFGTLHSNGYIFPFLLCFLLLLFSQLFVRPPQTAILLFCISFPWGWPCSRSGVVAERSYPTPEVTGLAERSYHTS